MAKAKSYLLSSSSFIRLDLSCALGRITRCVKSAPLLNQSTLLSREPGPELSTDELNGIIDPRAALRAVLQILSVERATAVDEPHECRGIR